MVSIIITYIDEHDFLTEAVYSALAQHLDQMEVIIVCNKSNLPTGYHPLPELKSKLKFIHEPATGSAYARNAGLHAANGEWIQFLDVDDLILPDKIFHQLSITGGAAVVSPHIYKYLDGSTQLSKWTPEDIWCGILDSGLGSTSSILWHRETLINIGGWSKEYQSHQEYELLFRWFASGYPITFVDHRETIVRERISGSITLQTQPVRAMEGIKLRESIWEYIVQHGLETPSRKNAFLQYIFRQLRGLYRRDREAALNIYSKYFPGERFNPVEIGIPFYKVLYTSLGFKSTEKLLSLYSLVRNRYLPFLPTNR